MFDNTPTAIEVVLLTILPPRVRTLPTSVARGGIVDNNPRINENLTLLCYQTWYC